MLELMSGVSEITGEETAWFDALPKEVQEHLNTLGVDAENFTL